MIIQFIFILSIYNYKYNYSVFTFVTVEYMLINDVEILDDVEK